MSLHHLFKACSAFEKLAQATGTSDFGTICNKFKGAIQAEAAGGIASINRLVTSNKEAAADVNLQTLDETFGKLSDSMRLLQPDTASITVSDMKILIVKNLFFTSGQNAGAGYDPITRLGGATSPAAYLDRIYEYVKTLEKHCAQNEASKA